jgi:hypothetical protein
MWLAIIYVCFTGNLVECGFVSTTLNTRNQCIETLASVTKLLDVDDEVLMYDKKCIELKIS